MYKKVRRHTGGFADGRMRVSSSGNICTQCTTAEVPDLLTDLVPQATGGPEACHVRSVKSLFTGAEGVPQILLFLLGFEDHRPSICPLTRLSSTTAKQGTTSTFVIIFLEFIFFFFLVVIFNIADHQTPILNTHK